MRRLPGILPFLLVGTALAMDPVPMERIEGGSYVPLYGADSTGVAVEDFLLDRYPVTNARYLAFVEAHPEWRRSMIPGLFADGNYLASWPGDTELPPDADPEAPVTSVSWFAAREYCACQGKRLATMDEWEFAALASPTAADAQADSAFNQWIIEGYETPRAHLLPVGRNPPNFWGVHDLHGLVWEWTEDFNSVLVSGESRKDADKDGNLFCAGGSVGASDLMDYAAFMRFAFRGSVKARFSIRTLGFRCARDVD